MKPLAHVLAASIVFTGCVAAPAPPPPAPAPPAAELPVVLPLPPSDGDVQRLRYRVRELENQHTAMYLRLLELQERVDQLEAAAEDADATAGDP